MRRSGRADLVGERHVALRTRSHRGADEERTEDRPISPPPLAFGAGTRRTAARTCFRAGRTSCADGDCRQLALGSKSYGGSAAGASRMCGGFFYLQTGGWRPNRRSIFILHSAAPPLHRPLLPHNPTQSTAQRRLIELLHAWKQQRTNAARATSAAVADLLKFSLGFPGRGHRHDAASPPALPRGGAES